MDVKKPSNWIPKYDDPDGMGSSRDEQNERMRRFTEAPDDRFVCNQCGHRFDHVDFCEELKLCIKCAFETQNPLN